jgi:glycosyltransferase involved in cell wall biosynthesis
MKTRVLLVLNDGNRGGIAKVVQPLLEKQGECIFKVICGSEGSFTDDLRKMGVSVGVIDLNKPLTDLAPIRALRREIRDFRPHVVHSHHSRAYLRGRVAAWMEGVPHISTPHNPVLDELDCRPGVSKFRKGLFLFREWISAGLDCYTVALSAHNRDRLLKQGIRAKRIRIIENGIDLEKFSPGEPDEGLLSSLSFTPSDRIIGVVGRLVGQKGIDDLIAAFARIPEKVGGSTVQLLIVGDGPDRDELERLSAGLGIKERVTFLGHRADTPELLRIMDVVVFPSRFEGLPVALLEAMAMERPIVAVDLPVFSSILTNKGGLIVKRNEICTGILKILEDPALAKEICSQANQIVKEYYNQKKMLSATYELYKEAAMN